MANVLVHNISNRTRPPGGPKRVVLGGVTVWPGRSKEVPEEVITAKHRAMLGTFLFFGALSPELAGVLAPVGDAPMTEDEFAEYVAGLDLPVLVRLGGKVTPPLRARANRETMARALVRSYRSPEQLDPEAFYFTRCWTRSGTDTFIPVW